MTWKGIFFASMALLVLVGCDKTPMLNLAQYNGKAPGKLMYDKQIGADIKSMIPPDRKLCLTDFYNYLPDLSLEPDGSLQSSLNGSEADATMVGYLSVFKNGQIFIAIDCSTDRQNPVNGAGLELYTSSNITPSDVPKSVTSWIKDGHLITYSNLLFSPAGKPASTVSVASLSLPPASGKASSAMTKSEMKSLILSASENNASAINTLKTKAQDGDALAQEALCLLYYTGKGVPKDYAKAISWCRKSADQGNADAQTSVGLMYELGTGVSQDYAQALSWYRKAADQGNAVAQLRIGFMYQTGRGVSQDSAQAIYWYRKSADQGNADAQLELGLIYMADSGIPKDYKQSIFWLRKSADQGNATAQKALNGIASIMQEKNTGPMLIPGAVVCEGVESMLRANAIIRSNNPYVSLPDDCIKMANATPLRSANSYSGLIKIEVNVNGELLQAWTTRNYIAY